VLPPLIHRRDFQASLGCSSESIRLAIRDKRLPPLDVDLGKIQGWYPDTLRAAGVKVPEPAAASQPTPEALAP
jgi:hypothetical protein